MGGDIGDQRREPWVERLPLAGGKPWQAYAAIGAILLVAFVARVALMPVVPVGSPFITFFPAVLLIGFLFGARRGMVAAAASVALAAVFFMANPSAPGYFATAVPSAVLFAILASFNLAVFHWMQSANAKLRAERARSAALAETRETLFRELQHRVSNNLQIAAGLLALQTKHVEGERARAALEEAARRLGVIGRISRQLYESDGGMRNLHALLEPLCGDVVEMSGRSGLTIHVHAAEDIQLAPEAALPLALVVAEAVANAIEHGLAGRETGTIEVTIGRDGAGALAIEVSDDGCGLPEGFDLATSSSLGLGIARTFAEQLGGRFELERGARTVARLRIPAASA